MRSLPLDFTGHTSRSLRARGARPAHAGTSSAGQGAGSSTRQTCRSRCRSRWAEQWTDRLCALDPVDAAQHAPTQDGAQASHSSPPLITAYGAERAHPRRVDCLAWRCDTQSSARTERRRSRLHHPTAVHLVVSSMSASIRRDAEPPCDGCRPSHGHGRWLGEARCPRGGARCFVRRR